jgi:hypothetical protein
LLEKEGRKLRNGMNVNVDLNIVGQRYVDDGVGGSIA